MEHVQRDNSEWFGTKESQSLPCSTLDDIAHDVPFIGYESSKKDIIKYDKVIIHGPIGIGKSLLARYYCQHFKDYSIYKLNPSCLSKYVGATEEYLHSLFSTNKAIIVVDHMETLLPQRNTSHSSVINRLIMQFLVHLDGITSFKCKFIGITCNLDQVDDAIKRPGRVDFILNMNIQDVDLLWSFYCDYYKTDLLNPGISNPSRIHFYIYNHLRK
eukprot:NODE_246_length_12992_cov_0.264407.p8 type:complete len:215 gc:universal NODE_246_length_12992_cov_0.264407:5015-4371(-)